MSRRLNVQVHFDLICPWCFIGKRHLDAALARLGEASSEVDVEVSWIAHELLPDTPAEGLPYQAFYEERLGGPAAVAARRAQVQAAARGTGIDFAFERIARMPNTRQAHRLITRLSGSATGANAALIERLFQAWFVEGQDIGDAAVLERLAAGIAASEAADAGRHRVALADGQQVPGVPLFVFNERVALSGAQPPDALLDGMRRALQVLPTASAPS